MADDPEIPATPWTFPSEYRYRSPYKLSDRLGDKGNYATIFALGSRGECKGQKLGYNRIRHYDRNIKRRIL